MHFFYPFDIGATFLMMPQVYERIDPEKGNFTTGELNPEPDEIRESVLECITMVQQNC